MTKVLAKTTGVTLVTLSGDFLDSYKFRIIEFDNRVRDWNNRKLLEIKCFLNDDVESSELDEMNLDDFVKKYTKNPESSSKSEEVEEVEEVEEATSEEEIKEEEIKEEKSEEDNKRRGRKSRR